VQGLESDDDDKKPEAEKAESAKEKAQNSWSCTLCFNKHDARDAEEDIKR
jgi:hypothetical protein